MIVETIAILVAHEIAGCNVTFFSAKM